MVCSHIITLKDGWSKSRGEASQWIRETYTYLFDDKRDLPTHIYVTLEGDIKDDFRGDYGNSIKAEFSAVLVKNQWIRKENGQLDPYVSTQILELGSTYVNYSYTDYKNGETDKWINKAKKTINPLLKNARTRYFQENVDYNQLWSIGHNWVDHDKLLQDKLEPKTEANQT